MRPFTERTGRPESCGSRSLVTLLLSSICVLGLAAPAGAATKAPEVGYQAASHVTTTSATIEVPINPEGGETSYEIWLECQSAKDDKQDCEPLTADPQRVQGVLPPSSEPQIATDAVTGLQPGYLYSYAVAATNSAGKEGYVGDGFLTCPTDGLCPSQPYLAGEALWNIEGAAREAAEAPRLEAERLAKQREAEERPAKEASERAAKERAVYEAGERAGREAAERAAQARGHSCLVPRLKGDSLTQARRALYRAHCRLGKITAPRNAARLIVVRQGVRSGVSLARGSRVPVALGHAGKQ